ncbi:MAG: helix-turn-helix transcriptional regulator [Selenomonadaceae bacterium]|nr:helix-turn-helix transcriptional regulator [Selenomonadaceae bacterium]
MRRLKELRRQQERTQADLAKLLGVTRTAISKLELGQQQPNAAQLLKLSNYFNVSVDFLLECEQADDSNETFDLLNVLECEKLFIGNHHLTSEERKILKGVIEAIFYRHL